MKIAEFYDAQKMNIKCGVENCQYNKSCMGHTETLEVNTMGDGKDETSDGTCCIKFNNR